MVAVTPEGDLVAGLDTEHVARFLGNVNLSLGANLVSHTLQHDLVLGARWDAMAHRCHVTW